MDSDEDFLSTVSSDDDIMLDDSENDDMSNGDEFDDAFDEDPDDEPDMGLQKQKTPVAYDVGYKVYSPGDIQKQQEEMMNEVNMILEMSKEDAAILLRHFRWNKERLIEDFMDNSDKVVEAAGIVTSVANPPQLETLSEFMCDICCDDDEGLQSFAMKCGHRYCVNCYRHYLTQKIREEGEAARIQCPAEGCSRIIDARSLDLLVTPELSDSGAPAPDCENAVECGIKKKDLDKVVPTVACGCGYRFCFGCILSDHQPAPCELVKRWLKKCADDSETANWISANTKECPKCNSTIEKNGGCNHMTCRKCKHEFCWMCMGLWSEHGTSWYNCNRFEEKSGTDARDAQAKSRVSLERYLHYYNRYANHEQSARLDKDMYTKTEKKMVQLQSASGMSWIEVQYLNSASQALQTCRQTLKWTYAFAFYLARNNLTEIFEDNQKDLEFAAENLSEMFEKPISELADSKLKVDIMDKTSYCNKRRLILLQDTAENLANGMFSKSVSLE
ncbi:putative ring-finger protein Ariadne-1 [Apiospora sp. TS-2023a]